MCASRVSVVKNPSVMQETGWRHGFNPWVREIPWRRKRQPTPILTPGKFQRRRSLAGCSPWGHRVRHNWPLNSNRGGLLTSLHPLWKGRVYSSYVHSFHLPFMPYKFVLLWLFFWTSFNVCLVLILSRALRGSWAQSLSVAPISLNIRKRLHSASMSFPMSRCKQLLNRKERWSETREKQTRAALGEGPVSPSRDTHNTIFELFWPQTSLNLKADDTDSYLPQH